MHRAQAGTAAEMGDQGAAAGQVAIALAQGDRLVLIGQSVKTVAAQATLPGIVGQRQHLLDHRHALVEGGVEAGDLGHLRVRGKQRIDRFERERLVQRRERD